MLDRKLRTAMVIGSAAAALASAAVAAPPAFQEAVLDDAPVLYYQLNEATGNADNKGSLGASHDATYNGTIQRGVPTPFGDTAVSFNGADDYLESLGVAPAGLLGNPTFTAEAIVFVPVGGTASNYAPFLHWGPSAVSPTGKSVYFSFSFNDATRVFAGFYNGGLRSPAGSLAQGEWHHIVWIRNGAGNPAANTDSIVYVDGVNITASLQDDAVLCCNSLTPAVEASVFRINRAQDFTRFFTGSIDELALYDRALDAAEVAAHFATLPLDTGLDVDANGTVDALSDGLLMLRYFFGFRGSTLVTGAVAGNCTRCTAAEIEAYILSKQ